MKFCSYLVAAFITCLMAASGAAFAHDGGGDWHGKPMHMLSPEKKQLVHDAMHRAREQNKALFPEMKKLHEHMRDIMKAGRFDRKAFLATQSRIAALRMKMQHNRVEAFASIAGKLTPDERRFVAMKFMMHRHGKFGHGKHGFGHGHDHGGWKEGHGYPVQDSAPHGDFSHLNQ